MGPPIRNRQIGFRVTDHMLASPSKALFRCSASLLSPSQAFMNSRTRPVRGVKLYPPPNWKLEPPLSSPLEPVTIVGPPPKSKFHGHGPRAAAPGEAQAGARTTGTARYRGTAR